MQWGGLPLVPRAGLAEPVEDPADSVSKSGTKLLFTFGNPLGEQRAVEVWEE